MAWTDLTFGAGSVLTAAKMTQLDENFDALAAQNAGAPLVTFPNSVLSADAGLQSTGVGSIATVHAGSGFVGPEVSSLATMHAGSGFVGPQVSSFATVHVGSGVVAPEVSSFGVVEVNSNISVFGGLRFPHFALRYNAGNPPTIVRQTNVSCLQRIATGEYVIHVSPAFTDLDYFLMNMGGASGAAAQRTPAFRAESSNLSRIAIRNVQDHIGGIDDFGVGLCVIGFGD